MPLDRRKVTRALTRKLECEESARDHWYYTFRWKGRVVAVTKVSHGRQHDISDNLVGQMARQMRVSRRLFEQIVRCTKYLEDYVAALRMAGEIADDSDDDDGTLV